MNEGRFVEFDGLGRPFSSRLRRSVAIRPEIARASVAALSIVAVAVRPLRERTVGTWTTVGKAIALPVLAVRVSALVFWSLAIRFERRALDIGLRGVRRRAGLRLRPMLLLLIKAARPLRRRGEPVRQPAYIIVVVEIVAADVSRLAGLAALGQSLRGLGRGDQAKIMFGVLEVILGRHRIAPGMSIARKLEIFLRHVMGVAPNLNVRAIGFIGARQGVGPPPVVRRPVVAHPLILAWSHCIFPIFVRLSPTLSQSIGRRERCRVSGERRYSHRL